MLYIKPARRSLQSLIVDMGLVTKPTTLCPSSHNRDGIETGCTSKDLSIVPASATPPNSPFNCPIVSSSTSAVLRVRNIRVSSRLKASSIDSGLTTPLGSVSTVCTLATYFNEHYYITFMFIYLVLFITPCGQATPTTRIFLQKKKRRVISQLNTTLSPDYMEMVSNFEARYCAADKTSPKNPSLLYLTGDGTIMLVAFSRKSFSFPHHVGN